jgi:hypothetical protein
MRVLILCLALSSIIAWGHGSSTPTAPNAGTRILLVGARSQTRRPQPMPQPQPFELTSIVR